MQAIVDSKKLVALLGESESEYPEETIPYHRVWPHEYIPEVITNTDRFINFDISAFLDPRNNVYKDLSVFFYVFCHQDVVRYTENGRIYMWYDKVACEIDSLLSDSGLLGVAGTLSLVQNIPYYPQQKFKGRLLKFTVKDFNNGLKYGR